VPYFEPSSKIIEIYQGFDNLFWFARADGDTLAYNDMTRAKYARRTPRYANDLTDWD